MKNEANGTTKLQTIWWIAFEQKKSLRARVSLLLKPIFTTVAQTCVIVYFATLLQAPLSKHGINEPSAADIHANILEL